MYSVFALFVLVPTVAATIECYQGVITLNHVSSRQCESNYCMYERCPVGGDCTTQKGTYSCGDAASCADSLNHFNAGGRYCCQTKLCTPRLSGDDGSPIGPGPAPIDCYNPYSDDSSLCNGIAQYLYYISNVIALIVSVFVL